MSRKRKRRYGTSLFLVLCGALLLVSIGVGQRLGDRVLQQSTERRAPVVAAPATPPPAGESVQARKWKREQIVTVATDPAFPDPRVTPTPEPPPPPRPKPALFAPKPLPSVRRTPKPIETTSASGGSYTSPPLPIPLGTPTTTPTSSPTPGEGPTPP